MNKALLDFYRCPETLVDFRLAGAPLAQTGYFHFGQNTVGYGQATCASAKMGRNGLPDLSKSVTSDGTTLQLPFDPSQIVDNLRRERYTANGYEGNRKVLSSQVIQKPYYWCRPLLCISVRKHIQRLFLRNWHGLPFPQWPVDRSVEQILETLLMLLLGTGKSETIPFIWFWPDGAPSCVMVTHDVETQAGLGFAPSLMDVDDRFGIKASFQLIPEAGYCVSRELVNCIRHRKFEVNIQDLNHDGNLFDTRERFLTRARLINRYAREYGARGFRAGRMYRNVEWFDALEVSYDMSVPNVAHLEPQRGGCCTVFPYFIGSILELPLTTTQDYSLFHILGDYSIELWKKQVGLIAEKHGLSSFLIHPDYVMEERALEVYKQLLAYLSDLRKEGKAWIALPQDVNQWWRERARMRLVCEGGKWRIVGRGHERARIAYARIVEDRIVYEVGEGSQSARGTLYDEPSCEEIALGRLL